MDLNCGPKITESTGSKHPNDLNFNFPKLDLMNEKRQLLWKYSNNNCRMQNQSFNDKSLCSNILTFAKNFHL